MPVSVIASTNSPDRRKRKESSSIQMESKPGIGRIVVEFDD